MPGEPKFDDQIRNTTKNVAIAVVKIHNLQVEVASLKSDIRTLTSLFLKLLPEESRHEFAEMVRRDNLTQKPGMLQDPR